MRLRTVARACVSVKLNTKVHSFAYFDCSFVYVTVSSKDSVANLQAKCPISSKTINVTP